MDQYGRGGLEGITERGARLIANTARFLAAYQRLHPEESFQERVVMTVVAVAAFESITTDLATEFVRTHWEVIDQTALAIDVEKDLEDL